MGNTITVQGRKLTLEDISFIQRFITAHPSWSRRRLSIELSKEWTWVNAKGDLKDMACRSMMLKLDRLGYINLPPRLQIPSNRMTQKKIPWIPHNKALLESHLKDLQPLRVVATHKQRQYDDLFSCLMSEYHYLGYRGVVGENMKYIIFDKRNRPVSCFLFGSSAWKTQGRDRCIGWDKETRERMLNYTTNNTRFLILPWVHVPHLASHVLGLVSRRISLDWLDRYGHEIYMLETFVERERFQGTCYKAANWICVGKTKGRSRNDRYSKLKVPVKDVYIYPLTSNYKYRLMNG
jgi:hypothetical protein